MIPEQVYFYSLPYPYRKIKITSKVTEFTVRGRVFLVYKDRKTNWWRCSDKLTGLNLNPSDRIFRGVKQEAIDFVTTFINDRTQEQWETALSMCEDVEQKLKDLPILETL